MSAATKIVTLEERARRERELLAGRTRKQRIPRRSGEGPPALSFAQRRLWLLEQIDGASPVYNMPSAVRIRGAFRVDAMQGSLERIVARHETLRTTFRAVDGVPEQVIQPPGPFDLPVVDLSNEPAEGREQLLAVKLKQDARRTFDLQKDCMVRATVYRLAPDDHVLLFVMHHIASDGWSVGVF